MKHDISQKKLSVIYFSIIILYTFIHGIWSFYHTSHENLSLMVSKVDNLINRQQMTLQYIEKKMLNIIPQHDDSQISKQLKEVEDSLYILNSKKSIYPAKINWIHYESPSKILGSYGEKKYNKLSPDLDYYYDCEEESPYIQNSMPYLSDKIEDLYLMNIGKAAISEDNKVVGCIDMVFSLKSILRVATKNHYNKLFSYLISSEKNNLILSYDPENKYDSKNKTLKIINDDISKYITRKLSKKSKVHIGIKNDVPSQAYYIWESHKIFILCAVILYWLIFTTIYVVNSYNRKNTLEQLMSIAFIKSNDELKSLKGKEFFCEVNSIINSKVNEKINYIKELTEKSNKIKQKTLSLNNQYTDLKNLQEKNSLLINSIDVEKKYGQEIKHNFTMLVKNIQLKTDIIKSYFNCENDINFSTEKVKNVIIKLKKDINSLKKLNFTNTITKSNFLDLVEDALNLNKHLSHNKKIKFCLNIDKNIEFIKTNKTLFTRAFSAILYHLIYNAPSETNIFLHITKLKNSNSIVITLKDDSFGYVKFNEGNDKEYCQNYFDMKCLSWSEIQNAIEELNGKISIKNIKYEGNTVEISIPINDIFDSTDSSQENYIIDSI